jgi:hypothetical protein
VVLEELEGVRVGPKVLDDDAGAADDLPGGALLVNLAETGHLAELLGLGDLDQVDRVLSAQGLNKLGVGGLRARGGKDAKVSLALVEGLGGLVDAPVRFLKFLMILYIYYKKGSQKKINIRISLEIMSCEPGDEK